MKNFTINDIECIKEKYLSKNTLKSIAKEYNVCYTTISNLLKNNGITPSKSGYTNHNKFSLDKELDIINMYKLGMTQKAIAEKFNTFNTSIRRVLKRHNIVLRGNDKVQRLCKHNPFKRNDEYSEYFLGLLLTDGCISKEKSNSRNYSINLSLSEVDKDVVEKFRDWASPTTKVSKIYQKLNSSYMYSVNITNAEAEDWLRRKGNFYRKSYECKIYTHITWNILRGIFDGDGGFHKCNNDGVHFFICGMSEVFMRQIHSFLIKNGINAYIRFSGADKWHKNGLYYVEVFNYADIIKIGLNMYSNAHIFIKRKYDTWLTFYESKRAKYALNSGKEMAIQP